MANKIGHPQDPRSNVAKFGAYDPENYVLKIVPPTVITSEALTPGRPPCLTQTTVGLYLVPTTDELNEVPPRPTISELPQKVLDRMVQKDKAFWVDNPGVNAYTLHDAYYNYYMSSESLKPTPQAVFPRSYQYELDSVKYRRLHACDGLKKTKGNKEKHVGAHCRDCQKLHIPGLTPFQLAWAPDPSQKRWRYYPDLSATMPPAEIKCAMFNVGRPFRNEACNWYYKNYPAQKFEGIIRKFGK